ncbi:MAG: ComF family protein [bacterium]
MDFKSPLISGCLICGSKTNHELFCKECDKFALTVERRCPRCGAFTLDPSKPDCFSCRGKKVYFDEIFSLFIYSGPIAAAISKMKYGKIESYATVLGVFLAKNIPVEVAKERKVVFPPMNFSRKFLRSFNQAEIIADKVAQTLKLDFERTLLKKIKKTTPQVQLTYEEREKNLKNAFKLTKDVKNGSFLIVDDVCTTFSTINTIAKLLKENGAKSVNGATVARRSSFFL